MLITNGDQDANVGNNALNIIGKFGLGVRNEAGKQLKKFSETTCSPQTHPSNN